MRTYLFLMMSRQCHILFQLIQISLHPHQSCTCFGHRNWEIYYFHKQNLAEYFVSDVASVFFVSSLIVNIRHVESNDKSKWRVRVSVGSREGLMREGRVNARGSSTLPVPPEWMSCQIFLHRANGKIYNPYNEICINESSARKVMTAD